MPLRQPSGRHGCMSSSSPCAFSCRLWDEFYLRILPSRASVLRELSTSRVHRWHGPGSGALEVINPLDQIRTSVWEVPSQETSVDPEVPVAHCPCLTSPKKAAGRLCVTQWSVLVSLAEHNYFCLPEVSQSYLNHQPEIFRMTSRMNTGSSVPLQCPVTWRDDAWLMPEPAADFWTPWETSTLLIREIVHDSVSPPSWVMSLES